MRGDMPFRGAAFGALLLAALLVARLDAAAPYEIQSLGCLASQESSTALGLNAHGAVVGHCRNTHASPMYKAFLWTPAGGMVAIDGLAWARDINDRGAVIGIDDYDGTHTAHRWHPDEGLTDLGRLPGSRYGLYPQYPHSDGVCINNADQVAGVSTYYEYHRRAVMWEANGAIVDLGLLPAGGERHAAAAGINLAG